MSAEGPNTSADMSSSKKQAPAGQWKTPGRLREEESRLPLPEDLLDVSDTVKLKKSGGGNRAGQRRRVRPEWVYTFKLPGGSGTTSSGLAQKAG